MQPISPPIAPKDAAAGNEPVELMLFMPEDAFAEIHGHATRLGITDTALFTACWLGARARIDADPTTPHLLSSSSGAVYFSLAAAVRDDALAFAQSHDRSMSWAFLKAWALVRAQVEALATAEQFARWRSAATPR